MKTLKWDQVEFKGATKTVPAKGVKVQPPRQPKEGMMATAQYNGVQVRLRIEETLKTDEFRATLMCFDTVGVEKPADVWEGDEVFVTQKDILWLHED